MDVTDAAGAKDTEMAHGNLVQRDMESILGSLCKISAPFTEAIAYRKAQNPEPKDEQKIQKRNRVILAVVIGIAVSIPILCIVGVLLLCADAVFYQMFCDMFDWVLQWHIPEWLSNGEVFRVLLMVVICFVYTYGMLAFCRKRQSQEEAVQESRPQWDAYVADHGSSIDYRIVCIVLWCTDIWSFSW